MESKLVVAWWGAILSTILLCIKIWELNRDKLSLEISFAFADDNIVYVFNPSKVSIIIKHYRVFWAKKKGCKLIEVEDLIEEDYEILHTPLPANSTVSLVLSRMYPFISAKKSSGKSLYIEMDVVGRKKKITKLVY